MSQVRPTVQRKQRDRLIAAMFDDRANAVGINHVDTGGLATRALFQVLTATLQQLPVERLQRIHVRDRYQEAASCPRSYCEAAKSLSTNLFPILQVSTHSWVSS